MQDYTIIRSKRKTMAIEVRGGEVIVRCPFYVPKSVLDGFVRKNESWIARQTERQALREERYPEPDEAQKRAYIDQAKRELPARVEYYARRMNVSPEGVRITGAKKRFGSCSATNRICFSWRLMQYPDEAIDYVVVHELAHIRHKNHGKEFYAFVASILPDYKLRRKLLR